MTETVAELERHTTVLYEAKHRHYHWLYADGTSYCGFHKPPYWSRMRLWTLDRVPAHGKHACKGCRKVAALIKKGKNPGHQPRTEVRHPGVDSPG